MKVEEVFIGSLHFDPANARKHPEKNMNAIMASLAKFGQEKPIVVDKNNCVLAGNGTLAAAKALGWEKIWVKRSQHEGAMAIAYAIADNRSSSLAEWEMDTLGSHLQGLQEEGWDLEELGFELDDLDDFEDLADGGSKSEESNYSRKIEPPIYEPTGPCPSVNDIYDTDRVSALIAKINDSDIGEGDKIFLKAAAWRHCVFNYQNIAEYYCHASKEVQALMEDSALVVIDFESAIEKGYVKMTEELAESFSLDHGGENE